MLGILSRAYSMSRFFVGIVILLMSSPLFGQDNIYAPIDSLRTMPNSRLDSLNPSAFTIDTVSKLTTISRPELVGPKRYLLAYQPGKAQTIYGIAIGIVGHDVICNAPYNQTTSGINLQIGAGLFHWHDIPFRYKPDPHWLLMDINDQKSITNGLQCSIFGTQTDVVNGVAISGFVSVGDRLNGLALNLGSSHYTLVNGMTVSFRNTALKTNGVQIGIINSSNQMNGVQIGLWNNVEFSDQPKLQIGLWNTINGKSFPILNFRR